MNLYVVSICTSDGTVTASTSHESGKPKLARLDVTYDCAEGCDVVRAGYSPPDGTTISVSGRDVISRPGNQVIDPMLKPVARPQSGVGQNEAAPAERFVLSLAVLMHACERR